MTRRTCSSQGVNALPARITCSTSSLHLDAHVGSTHRPTTMPEDLEIVACRGQPRLCLQTVAKMLTSGATHSSRGHGSARKQGFMQMQPDGRRASRSAGTDHRLLTRCSTPTICARTFRANHPTPNSGENPGLLERYAPFARHIGLQAWPFRHCLVQSRHARQFRQLSLGRERKRETQSLDQLEQGQIGIGDDAANQMICTRRVRFQDPLEPAEKLRHPIPAEHRGTRDGLGLLFVEPLILIDRMVANYTPL